MDGSDGCNIGRDTQWIFVEGLRFNPKADLEKIGLAILIFWQNAKQWLCQSTPKGIIGRELGGHCAHDSSYMRQAPLVSYLTSFALPTGLPWPLKLWLVGFGTGDMGLQMEYPPGGSFYGSLASI